MYLQFFFYHSLYEMDAAAGLWSSIWWLIWAFGCLQLSFLHFLDETKDTAHVVTTHPTQNHTMFLSAWEHKLQNENHVALRSNLNDWLKT